MDEKIKEVMGLVTLYGEAVSDADDSMTMKSVKAEIEAYASIESKLRELVQSPKINGYESGMQSGSKVTLWFESTDAAEAWFDNFTENFQE